MNPLPDQHPGAAWPLLLVLVVAGVFALAFTPAPPPSPASCPNLLGEPAPAAVVPAGLVDPEPCSDVAHARLFREFADDTQPPVLEPAGGRPAAPELVPGRDLVRPRKGGFWGPR